MEVQKSPKKMVYSAMTLWDMHGWLFRPISRLFRFRPTTSHDSRQWGNQLECVLNWTISLPFMLFRHVMHAYYCLQTVPRIFSKRVHTLNSIRCTLKFNFKADCIIIMSSSHCLEKAPLGIANGHAPQKEKNSKKDLCLYKHVAICVSQVVNTGLLV